MKSADKIGKLLIAGFEGYTVTPQARKLITVHRVGSMILGRQNFQDSDQIKALIQDLQRLAQKSNYEYPLILAVDQEGGMCNALFDEAKITQFPGNMALAASGSDEICYSVGKAIGEELMALGFNLFMGPVLDICSKMSNQMIGVRSFGSSVEDVSRFGAEFARGLKDAGMIVIGKHFPGIGSSFVDNLLELPMLMETGSQLESFNVLPFKSLIDKGLVHGLAAGGCAVPNISPDEIHACLSSVVINKILRKKLQFQGVVLSECLELEALHRNMGLGQGVIMAVFAGCDMIMICHDLAYQEEALESLHKAYRSEEYAEVLKVAITRIETLQKEVLTWPKALDPPKMTEAMWLDHQRLSTTAYQKSISLVRDNNSCLPITKFLKKKDTVAGVLLLTPLVTNVHPEAHNLSSPLPEEEEKELEELYQGEEIFRDFGQRLSTYGEDEKLKVNYKVLHTSYTANGLTNVHEELIENCKVIILVTSDASRNMYQIGLAKHVSVLCGANYKYSSSINSKPLIIISVSSPYDFLYHNGIGSAYICTYDYTTNVLKHLPAVLFGLLQPTGMIPGEHPRGGPYTPPEDSVAVKDEEAESADEREKKRRKFSRPWLVEQFELERDFRSLISLLKNNVTAEDGFERSTGSRSISKLHQLLANRDQKHFVVRNSSLNVIYGICITWVFQNRQTKNKSKPKPKRDDNESGSEEEDEQEDEETHPEEEQEDPERVGSIVLVVVDRNKRRQSIGELLHAHAMAYLDEMKCQKVRLGSDLPLVYFPADDVQSETASSFFNSVGWKGHLITGPTENKCHILRLELGNWSVGERLVRQLQVVGIRFEIRRECADVLKLIDCTGIKGKVLRYLYSAVAQRLASSETSHLTVISAVEPSRNSVVGSLVVYNSRSWLSQFYPFIDSAFEDEDEDLGVTPKRRGAAQKTVGGLTGLFIDPEFDNLRDVFKLGLICTGVSYCKRQTGMERLVVDGIEDAQLAELKDSGFEVWKTYKSDYGEMKVEGARIETQKVSAESD
ncbi:unnamed protein product [Kuraishia capsulata CBS 1993]|uniref:Glycoside hydrolase family 3 N-terminal domain-containing protein n=1 Tax=Kuraishia capsulata CBS 1993 TaxID=1382522 RepID=W6MQZ0_9ASCO|nr:uncharacterized protein KUCA_T00005136001 [Kuraishia capsulata CBS 1993]CDK29149.1 unnamed protein product [Kuraishia capsulata CBS 1993]